MHKMKNLQKLALCCIVISVGCFSSKDTEVAKAISEAAIADAARIKADGELAKLKAEAEVARAKADAEIAIAKAAADVAKAKEEAEVSKSKAESETAKNKLRAAEAEQAKLAALEKQFTDNPDKFDWKLNNELRHMYSVRSQEKKAFKHCDIIFKNSLMDTYTLDCCGARGTDKELCAANLIKSAEKYPEYLFLAAACWIKAAELQSDNGVAKNESLQKVLGLKGDGLDRYHALAKSKL